MLKEMEEDMTVNATTRVRELVLEIPGALRFFEKVKIDYCCGGERTLEEACAARGLSVETVLRSLDEMQKTKANSEEFTNWKSLPLSQLTRHIVDRHHAYTREQLALLGPLLEKVKSVHAERHSELIRLQSFFQALEEDLTMHMAKEERVLFPYIEEMEAAAQAHLPLPVPLFGTVQNPIRMMLLEHDAAAGILSEIREATQDFALPEDVCLSFQSLYRELQALEQDLHQHIHLENNVLFPRAAQLEGKVGRLEGRPLDWA